jgi:hypothetical protein
LYLICQLKPKSVSGEWSNSPMFTPQLWWCNNCPYSLVLLNLPSQNQYLNIGIGELKKNSPMLTSPKVDGAKIPCQQWTKQLNHMELLSYLLHLSLRISYSYWFCGKSTKSNLKRNVTSTTQKPYSMFDAIALSLTCPRTMR